MTTTTTPATSPTPAAAFESVRDIVAKVTASVREDIASLEADLAAPVLDGTPWATVVEFPSIGEAVLGVWTDLEGRTVRGFRALSTVPWHFCGAILSDDERSARKIAVMAKAGHVATARHIRDLKTEKLAALRARLAELEAQFARFNV